MADPMVLARSIISRLLVHPRIYALWAKCVDSQKQQVLRELLAGWNGTRVMDVGCGTGNSVALLHGVVYVGLDANPAYVALARRGYPGRKFVVADATLPFPEKGFDLVLINSLLHHMDDAGVLAVLRNAAAALNDKGEIITLEPLIPPPRNSHVARMLMRLDRGKHFRSWQQWDSLFLRAGLEVQRERRLTLKVGLVTGWHLVAVELRPFTPPSSG